MTDTPRVFLAAYHDGLSPRYEVVPEGAMGAEPWVPEGAGVRVKPVAAETLAKEIQMIVAADRWKGRSLDATPPEKWHRLRPETQQFWIDTATRILAALEPVAQPEPTSGAYDLICCTAEDVATGRGFSGDAAADLAMAQESLRVALALVGWKG